jgi:hypothetical protein
MTDAEINRQIAQRLRQWGDATVRWVRRLWCKHIVYVADTMGLRCQQCGRWFWP